MSLVFHAAPLGPRLLLRAKVQAPGSRGGHGYFASDGTWRYGERPPAGEQLPEHPDRYFHLPAGTQHMPMEKLRPRHTRSDGITSAAEHMRRAHDGTGGKRGPLTVWPAGPDGTHPIRSGNSTYHVAKQHGWSTIPVRIEDPGPPTAEDRAEVRDRHHMTDCPTCRGRAQMHPDCAARDWMAQ